MNEIKEIIINILTRVFPEPYFPAIILCAFIFLIFISFKKRAMLMFVSYGILTLICFFLPPVIKIMSRFTYGGFSYWRMLWLFPFAAYIAAAAAIVTDLPKNKVVKAVIAIVIAAAVCIAGKNVYFGGNVEFTLAENPEKVPESTMEIARLIEENVEKTGNEFIRAALPVEYTPYIRQVDGRIDLLNGLGANYHTDNEADRKRSRARVWFALNGYPGWLDKLPRALVRSRSNYVLIQKDMLKEADIESAGYAPLGTVGDHILYYCGDIKPPEN